MCSVCLILYASIKHPAIIKTESVIFKIETPHKP